MGDYYYIPGTAATLTSLGTLQRNGGGFIARPGTTTVELLDTHGNTFATGRLDASNCYPLTFHHTILQPQAHRVVRGQFFTAAQVQRAHEARAAHEADNHAVSYKRMGAAFDCQAVSTHLTSLDCRLARLLFGPCANCVRGKLQRKPQPPSRSPPPPIGTQWHFDLHGFTTPVVGGYRWALIAKERATGYLCVLLLLTKQATEIVKALTTFVTFLRNRGFTPDTFRSDPEQTLRALQKNIKDIFGITVTD
jgi:hypothetical protein